MARSKKTSSKNKKSSVKPQIVKRVMSNLVLSEKLIVSAVHQATESITKPPKCWKDVMEGFENMEKKMTDLCTSVERLQKENDRLNIEVLKNMDCSSQVNMKILELLTMQNNYFQSRLNQVYAPTARRNTPSVIQGTPTFSVTAVEL